MKKNYQMNAVAGATAADLPMPERVTVAMAELTGALKEGLLALAVGAGLQVMAAVMEESVTELAGPEGRHDPNRVARRHGREAGSVTLGGRRVPVRRPRVRAADGSGELAVPAYEVFASTELLGELALERMMAKLSTRRYSAGLEPVGSAVEAVATSTSKSSVSRRFIERTETALAEMLSADLSGLDLAALMVDGVQFAESCCVVALGITADGTKEPLGLVEGATENATVVTDLLVGLRERGLDVTRPTLVVIDGSKALASAVRAVFDRPVIQRCQLHKVRNVEAKLPKALAALVAKKMRAAYRDADPLWTQPHTGIFLMSRLTASAGPLEAPVECQARMWPRQRRSVRAMPRSSGTGLSARSSTSWSNQSAARAGAAARVYRSRRHSFAIQVS